MMVKKLIKLIKSKGAPGFEPGTSRSAVECSTTELYPHDHQIQPVYYKQQTTNNIIQVKLLKLISILFVSVCHPAHFD